MPIIVGGTHYYIQSLIWDSLLAISTTTPEEDSLDDLPTEKLYARLQEVDPDNTQHPNQRKRILADLRLFAQTGVPPSQLRRQQNAERNPQEQLDNVVVWLSCGEGTLRKRLDARVDSMVRHGLLEENAQFVRRFIAGSDLQRGVWQAIGLKEFLPLFLAEDGSYNGRMTLDATGGGREGMKRRGSRADGVAAGENGHGAVCEAVGVRERVDCRQITWIRNRLLGRVQHLIQVDTSQLEFWDQAVLSPVINVADHLLDGTLPTVEVNNAFWDQQSAR